MESARIHRGIAVPFCFPPFVHSFANSAPTTRTLRVAYMCNRYHVPSKANNTGQIRSSLANASPQLEPRGPEAQNYLALHLHFQSLPLRIPSKDLIMNMALLWCPGFHAENSSITVHRTRTRMTPSLNATSNHLSTLFSILLVFLFTMSPSNTGEWSFNKSCPKTPCPLVETFW